MTVLTATHPASTARVIVEAKRATNDSLMTAYMISSSGSTSSPLAAGTDVPRVLGKTRAMPASTVADIAARIREGNDPRLVVLDQSTEDQLVPMNQKDRLVAALAQVSGSGFAQGHRLTGKHAAPWEEGITICQSLLDTLRLLREDS